MVCNSTNSIFFFFRSFFIGVNEKLSYKCNEFNMNIVVKWDIADFKIFTQFGGTKKCVFQYKNPRELNLKVRRDKIRIRMVRAAKPFNYIILKRSLAYEYFLSGVAMQSHQYFEYIKFDGATKPVSEQRADEMKGRMKMVSNKRRL